MLQQVLSPRAGEHSCISDSISFLPSDPDSVVPGPARLPFLACISQSLEILGSFLLGLTW